MSTARQLAAELDAERRRLEDLGVRQARETAREARGAALQLAGLAGMSPARAARAVTGAYLSRLEGGLADAMLASYLTARARTFRQAEPHLVARRPGLRLSLFDGAVAVMKKRLELSTAQLEALRREFGKEAVNVTNGFNNELENALREAMVRIVEQGEAAPQGLNLLREAMRRVGIDDEAPYRLETYYRTQVQQAYGASRWQAAQEPEIAEILWGFEYVAILDDRARPSHAARDGMRLAKNDPTWTSWWPPNGFNCRCTTIELFAAQEPVRKGSGDPDPGFSFNPGQALGAAA
jgi:SPP1 gp7 family putative phage head morphogenesis protein